MNWIPDSRFLHQDVFIIGGGASLSDFDFRRLEDHNTIGCNGSYMLGVDLCNVCFFSDPEWFDKHYENLCDYEGDVITHSKDLCESNVEWLKWMPRERVGLHNNAIGYNYSSGASAINLALIMGAERVFLLGIDCGCQNKANQNWYQNSPQNNEVYSNFIEGFKNISKDLPLKFPQSTIINLNHDSCLDCFPKDDIGKYL